MPNNEVFDLKAFFRSGLRLAPFAVNVGGFDICNSNIIQLLDNIV